MPPPTFAFQTEREKLTDNEKVAKRNYTRKSVAQADPEEEMERQTERNRDRGEREQELRKGEKWTVDWV